MSRITDSCRINFLELLYFDEIKWVKDRCLWFIGKSGENLPYSSDFYIRGAIDKILVLEKQGCRIFEEKIIYYGEDYELESVLQDSYNDVVRLNFIDSRIFTSFKYSYERNLWEIGVDQEESKISVSSGLTLRNTIDRLLGIKHPDYKLN